MHIIITVALNVWLSRTCRQETMFFFTARARYISKYFFRVQNALLYDRDHTSNLGEVGVPLVNQCFL